MKTFTYNFIKTLAIWFLLSVSINASEVKGGMLIAGSNVQIDNVSSKELKNIFMGKLTLLENGERINIGLYTENKEKTDYLFSNFLKTSDRRYKKYWLKQVFSGNGIAPKIFKNFKEVMSYANNNRNSILLLTLSGKKIPSNIKIIKVDGKESF